MSTWSPEDVAVVVAAVASAGLFIADRVPHVWRALTARTRWLESIVASHPPTATVLGALRTTQHRPLRYIGSIGYALPFAAFGAPDLVPTSILPAGDVFTVSLLVLSAYAFGLVVIVDRTFRVDIPGLLSSAPPAAGVPHKASHRYNLGRDLALGWIPALTGIAAGQLSNSAASSAVLSPTFLGEGALLVYVSYLAFSEAWTGIRRVEQLAYGRFLPPTGGFPYCEIRLTRGSHRPSEEVAGSAVDIGRSLRLVRPDGFAEEFDWSDVRRLAVKQPTAVPT